MSYELIHGDCLEKMRDIPDASIDCVLTDPPYGTTACKWDSVIPFEPMWKELKRIAKPKAAICLFGSQPFTSALVMSNAEGFKYQWVWQKQLPTGFLDARNKPLKDFEDVLVFTDLGYPRYFPQGLEPVHNKNGRQKKHGNGVYGFVMPSDYIQSVGKFPRMVVKFDRVTHKQIHPTQKPVELLRYLVRTYTLENETVLDFTMGSGSTGVACLLENRNFIGIEKDDKYFEIAKNRIEQTLNKEPMFATA
jgi:DNA modification methylase